MNTDFDIRLASQRDAVQIAEMSRTMIEVGLGWSWTPKRIIRSVLHPEINIAVVDSDRGIAGFGVTRYTAQEAHIPLLAVDSACRRKGVGRALMSWIEKTVLTAGIGVIYLEARLGNTGARAFYRSLGYREIKIEPHMYKGIEPGVRLAKDLWLRSNPVSDTR